MFNKNIRLILGIILSAVSGVLLHFAYEWSGNNKIVGYLSAVNESTWEHLKLLFVPVFAFTLLEYFVFHEKGTSFLFSRTISVILGMAWIVVAFYTISGISGKTDMPVINIMIYVIGVIFTFWFTSVIQKSIFNTPKYADIFSILLLCVIFLLFIVWTYNPPATVGIFYNYLS